MIKRVGDYEIGDVIGEGSFGMVRLALKENEETKVKEKFAIKIIDKEKVKKEDLIQSLKQEISILMMINHPNVVRLIEVLASKTKIYLVFEYVDGGELFDLIQSKQKIEEKVMRSYFRQILKAIDYCKSKSIAHRDIKPENILITRDGVLKVSDFGLSSLYKDPQNLTKLLHTTCGTINYLAPEVIQNIGYDGHKADVWSLGVLLYFAVAGYLPFEDDNVKKLLEKIVAAEVEYPATFSKQLKCNFFKIIASINIQSKSKQKNKFRRYYKKSMDFRVITLFQCMLTILRGINQLEIIDLTENSSFQKQKQEMDQLQQQQFKQKLTNIDLESNVIEDGDVEGQFKMSPLRKQNKKKILKPRKMNAFELANFLAGSILNRIFDVDLKQSSMIKPQKLQKQLSSSGVKFEFQDIQTKKQIECCSYFTVQSPIKNLTEIIKADFNGSNQKQITIFCEIFEIQLNYYLVNFTKGQDTELKDYLKVYKYVFEKIPEELFN